MTTPDKLEKGADARKNWTTINGLRRLAQDQRVRIELLEAAVLEVRSRLHQRNRGGSGDCCYWS